MEVEHKYTKETFFGNLIEILIQRWIKGRRLRVLFNLKPEIFGGKAEYIRTEYWTDTTAEELHASGYVEAVGLHDSIWWWGVKRYVLIKNGLEFPIAEVRPDLKDTAYTINNAALSRALDKFKKAMARAQLTETADWQKIGLMVLLGVGVIIATKWFGIW